MTQARGRLLTATDVGSTAELLLGKARVGSVQGVFPKALNVLVGERMFCIVRSDVGRSPMNVVCDVAEGASLAEFGVRPGMQIRRKGRSLVVNGGALTVRLPPSGAGASPNIRRLFLDVRQTWANLARLRDEIILHGNLMGLGGVLFAAPWTQKGRPAEMSPAAKAAASPLAEMVDAVAEGNLETVSAAARELIGLGPGLTPAGDDVLAGLMMALLISWKALGREDDFAERVNSRISSQTDGRTTRLSAEFLLHAARGLGSERAASLLDRVIFGRPEDIQPAARRLFDTGATSGTDAALGILLGVTASLEAGRRKGA